MDGVLRFVCREEKKENLDVIPMCVTDEDVNSQRLGFEFFQQSIAKLADTRARIEHNEMIA